MSTFLVNLLSHLTLVSTSDANTMLLHLWLSWHLSGPCVAQPEAVPSATAFPRAPVPLPSFLHLTVLRWPQMGFCLEPCNPNQFKQAKQIHNIAHSGNPQLLVQVALRPPCSPCSLYSVHCLRPQHLPSYPPSMLHVSATCTAQPKQTDAAAQETNLMFHQTLHTPPILQHQAVPSCFLRSFNRGKAKVVSLGKPESLRQMHVQGCLRKGPFPCANATQVRRDIAKEHEGGGALQKL